MISLIMSMFLLAMLLIITSPATPRPFMFYQIGASLLLFILVAILQKTDIARRQFKACNRCLELSLEKRAEQRYLSMRKDTKKNMFEPWGGNGW